MINTFSSVFTKKNIESMTKLRQEFAERKCSNLIYTEIDLPIVENKLRNMKLNAKSSSNNNPRIWNALQTKINVKVSIFKFKNITNIFSGK